MIRFIDLRGQGTGHRFAFWCTVYGRFCEFNDSQAWTSLEEFRADFEHAGGRYNDRVKISGVDRFEGLCPDWVRDGKEDDEE